jgi:hypothetical protein
MIEIYKKYHIPELIVVVLLIILSMSIRKCNKQEQNINLYEASQDTLVSYKNKYGEQISQISILETNNKKMFLKMKTQDSTIIKLQKMVKDYEGIIGSATLVSNTTSSSGASFTIINNTEYDTIIKDSIVYLYPQYETTWGNKWEQGYILAKKDSIFRDIKIRNEFEIITGLVKNGWFKKKTNEVIIKNLNPNTITQELRTFELKQTDKKFYISLQGGYGIGLRNFQPTPYIGIGLSYNLIGIK